MEEINAQKATLASTAPTDAKCNNEIADQFRQERMKDEIMRLQMNK